MALITSGSWQEGGKLSAVELMEALALLLVRAGEFRRAFDVQIALAMHRGEGGGGGGGAVAPVFELVEAHGLWGALAARIWPLLEIDAQTTVKFLSRCVVTRDSNSTYLGTTLVVLYELLS